MLKALGLCTLAGLPSVAQAIIFMDDFTAGASPQWENNFGDWSAGGGVYSAGSPENFPNALSALPFVLEDFEVELDINNVTDGGVWLRSADAPSTAVGRSGVLLVAGAGGGSLYWHIVGDGSSYGGSFNIANGIFTPGVSDPHLRVTVLGDVYSVYVDGSPTPATTLTTSQFDSGQFALYSNSSQTFDNVTLVPEPGMLGLVALAGLATLLLRHRRG